MNPLLSLVFCTLLCGAFAYNVEDVPVYIFTNPDNPALKAKTLAIAPPRPAFPTVKPDAFTATLDAYKSHKKVIIVLDHLSPEFFSKDLEHLPTFRRLDYLPLAQKPSAVLDNMAGGRTPITVANGLGKTFADFGSDVDTIVAEWGPRRSEESVGQYKGRLDRALANLLKDLPDVVFILTGAQNTKALEQQALEKEEQAILSRKTRAVPAPGAAFKYDNLLVYYTAAYEHFKKDTKKPISEFKFTNIKPDGADENKLNVVFESQTYNIVISFEGAGGAWAATSARVNNNNVTGFTPIEAPAGFSFACAKSFKIRLDGGSGDIEQLQIQGLQIQPKFKSDSFDLSKFGAAYDCVGFTSPGIWAGIFVTLLLLIIMTIGITALMDIRSMDRFDDPKGKTITINTNE